MYRLNVQVTASGRQTVPDRDVVGSCDPTKYFGGSSHITGMAEPKVVKFYTQVGYINSTKLSINYFKILLFVVMQRVTQVRQQQLSLLLWTFSR